MSSIEAAKSAEIGIECEISVENPQMGRRVRIGNRVRINAKNLKLGDNVVLEDDVVINADQVEIGNGSRIGTRCLLQGMKGPAQRISIGENTLISHDCKILIPLAEIGDYTAIHNHALLNGREPLYMGHNVWVGQNCMLNSEATLFIGNNVGIGAYSSVYTHGYFGDMLEGCQVFKIAPVRLEDDVWVLGCYNIISPGVTIGEKSLVLTGSNVTRNVPPNSTVGGAPAKDLTERMVPYKPVPVPEKLKKIREYLLEYLRQAHASHYSEIDGGFRVEAPDRAYKILILEKFGPESDFDRTGTLLVFAGSVEAGAATSGLTAFDMTARTYTRTRSEAEIEVITFLKSYRARFVPTDRPRIGPS